MKQCSTADDMTTADAPHQCAVAMEYEILSASKLPVSYKAAVMKRVNEIKRLTSDCCLHPNLMQPCATTDAAADDDDDDDDDDGVYNDDSVKCTADSSHMLSSSIKVESSPCSTSIVETTADANAVNVLLSDTCCDKDDDVASFSLAWKLKSSEESGDNNCDDDVVKLGNLNELRVSVESSSTSETASSNRNKDSLDDHECLKNDSSNRCETQSLHDVVLSDVGHSSETLVKSESKNVLTAEAADKPTIAAVKTRKSVRISHNSPTVSYIDYQQGEVVCNCAVSTGTVKVCRLQ